MDHARHPACALEEAFSEVARPVVEVPIIPLGKNEAFGCLETNAVDFSERHQEARELLAAGDDAEFGGLEGRGAVTLPWKVTSKQRVRA